MLATDAGYQKSMGQRTGLSHADAKIINKAYCAGNNVTMNVTVLL